MNNNKVEVLNLKGSLSRLGLGLQSSSVKHRLCHCFSFTVVRFLEPLPCSYHKSCVWRGELSSNLAVPFLLSILITKARLRDTLLNDCEGDYASAETVRTTKLFLTEFSLSSLINCQRFYYRSQLSELCYFRHILSSHFTYSIESFSLSHPFFLSLPF